MQKAIEIPTTKEQWAAWMKAQGCPLPTDAGYDALLAKMVKQ